jgi:hypothetical protein
VRHGEKLNADRLLPTGVIGLACKISILQTLQLITVTSFAMVVAAKGSFTRRSQTLMDRFSIEKLLSFKIAIGRYGRYIGCDNTLCNTLGPTQVKHLSGAPL